MNKENIISLKEEYILHIEKVLNYSSNTVTSYGRDLSIFIEFCRKIELEKISLLDEKIIREFVSYLHRNGISPKSIKRRVPAARPRRGRAATAARPRSGCGFGRVSSF